MKKKITPYINSHLWEVTSRKILMEANNLYGLMIFFFLNMGGAQIMLGMHILTLELFCKQYLNVI